MARLLGVALIVCLCVGCGRYFPGPVTPMSEDRQEPAAVIRDDGSVLFNVNRLEISLRPISDEELNRQFPSRSKDPAHSPNPFTYGDWKPMGDTYTPQKYTVFLLLVKNYEYPKVHVDPAHLELISHQAHRRFDPLPLTNILEYYYSLAQAYSGPNYFLFQSRRDLLIRSLYSDEVVFSSQEKLGYVLFPALPPDVSEFEVHVRDIALRFDFRDSPVETTDLVFRFEREVLDGYHPPERLGQG